jgi:hypothetical protein
MSVATTIRQVAMQERDRLAGIKRHRDGSPVRWEGDEIGAAIKATPVEIGALFQHIHEANTAMTRPPHDPLNAAEPLESAYHVLSGIWRANPDADRVLSNLDVAISDALQAIQKFQCEDGDQATNRRDLDRNLLDIRDAYTAVFKAARRLW